MVESCTDDYSIQNNRNYGGGIYFVSIIFMKRQHFPKNDKTIIRFVLFKFFGENPPNSFDGFQLTMSQSTF